MVTCATLLSNLVRFLRVNKRCIRKLQAAWVMVAIKVRDEYVLHVFGFDLVITSQLRSRVQK